MVSQRQLVTDVARNGFVIIPNALGHNEVSQLISLLRHVNEKSSVRKRQNVYAMRNLMSSIPLMRDLAVSTSIRQLVEPILGRGAFPVRGLLFDKTPDANWKVPWHQDLSIAVQRRIDVPEFGPWSMKAGVLHVQPPAKILEAMIAVRIHLDDCIEANGPLMVIPGSHLEGRLSAEEIRAFRARTQPKVCAVSAGGVVVMRPLLLHASSAAKTPGHRRVIHLEYAAVSLPGGLRWLEVPF